MSQDQLRGKLIPKQTLRGRIHRSAGIDDYEKLRNKPQINGVELSGDLSTEDLGITEPVNADWNASEGLAKILNKPTIPAAQVNSDWEAVDGVAKILNKPTIPAAQIQSDWNQTDDGVADYIKNKPELPSSYVTIDDTTKANDKTWSSNKISDEIIDILPTGTESGAAASFKTSLALPLVSIDVDSSATKVYQRGTNLWNEVWETGDYDNQGNKRVYTTRLRCKDKIPVSPSVVYRFYMVTASGLAWQFYDENGTFISQQSRAAGQGGFDITTPNNCHFLTFGTWDAYGGTYKNDISVNCPHTNTNAYYPYNPLSAEYSIDELDNIITFEGINNIFADSGNVNVVYKKSINDAIAELQALIL